MCVARMGVYVVQRPLEYLLRGGMRQWGRRHRKRVRGRCVGEELSRHRCPRICLRRRMIQDRRCRRDGLHRHLDMHWHWHWHGDLGYWLVLVHADEDRWRLMLTLNGVVHVRELMMHLGRGSWHWFIYMGFWSRTGGRVYFSNLSLPSSTVLQGFESSDLRGGQEATARAARTPHRMLVARLVQVRLVVVGVSDEL
jgi:hypothetical protein